jgi:hypothetical protein
MANIGNKIINYTLSKLFFPKVIMVDNPGITYSYVDRKFGTPKAKRRMIWHFEDIIVNLQLEATKELGIEKTSELWYKIGKDVGMRYISFSGMKKAPSFLLGSILKYIFKTLYSSGQSFAEKISFDSSKKELVIEGSNNIFCRKTGDGSFTAGLVSSIISCLVGKNIEAVAYCKCPNHCNIIAKPSNKKRYIPNRKRLEPDDIYFKLNFPTKIIFSKKDVSFRDMIKFKKIQFDKGGKFNFKNKALIPAECGMVGIIADRYINNGIKGVFSKGVVQGAEKLAIELLPEKETPIIKLRKILDIYCAFGNGIPSYGLIKNVLRIHFRFAPYTKFGSYYSALALNGFINVAFKKKFKLKEIKFDKFSSSVTFTYY